MTPYHVETKINTIVSNRMDFGKKRGYKIRRKAEAALCDPIYVEIFRLFHRDLFDQVRRGDDF